MKKWIAIVLVAIVALVVVVVGSVAIFVWGVASAVDTTETDVQSATAAFDEVLERFPDPSPILELVDGEPRLARPVPDTAPAEEASSVHVLVWERTSSRLTRVDLPIWTLRMAGEGNIEIDQIRGSLPVSPADIERYGPAIVVNGETQQGRLLIWSD